MFYIELSLVPWIDRDPPHGSTRFTFLLPGRSKRDKMKTSRLEIFDDHSLPVGWRIQGKYLPANSHPRLLSGVNLHYSLNAVWC
jgi:hypothetical protein